jgi:hypothetical protein
VKKEEERVKENTVFIMVTDKTRQLTLVIETRSSIFHIPVYLLTS